MNDLLGVVSWNENGFWQVDVFDTRESDESPIWFCTGERGGESNAVADKAFEKFGKELNIVMGFWGECEECGEEQITPVTQCPDCGGETFNVY